MIKQVLVETHCHTSASSHAYCTLLEMVSYAHRIGLEGITITDHGPAMVDSTHLWHFQCQWQWPKEMEGIRVYSGAEVNIMGVDGSVDLPEETLGQMDFVVASAHGGLTPAMNYDEATQAYLNLLNNPHIDVLGHSGTPAYAYDIDCVLKEATRLDKVIEINNHSFYVRKKSIPNCVEIAKAAKRYGTKICISTDAHICYELGHHEDALAMLAEIDFPEELIINRNREAFEAHICAHKPKQN